MPQVHRLGFDMWSTSDASDHYTSVQDGFRREEGGDERRLRRLFVLEYEVLGCSRQMLGRYGSP